MSENDTPQGTNPNREQTTGETPRAKRPSHIAYSVREGAEGQAYFNRVGSAFQHKDGQGFDVALDATPVNGRITLRALNDRLDAKRSGQGQGKGQTRGSQDHDR